MNTLNVEVAVIGAGTAGLAAYRAAVAQGKRTVIIEGGPYGTTCARVGCMPSKLLIAAAEAAHGPAKWDEFGLRLHGDLVVDGEAVMARVRRERDRFVGFVLEGVESIPAADRVRGFARFADDNTLLVDDAGSAKPQATRIVFERAVIATGSSPAIPPFLKTIGDRLIVNDDVFDWDALPKSVAVFGPGVIGLELGQALHRLGVDVLLFGRSGHVGPFSDPEVLAYALRQFASEMRLDAQADVKSVVRVGDQVELTFRGVDGHDEVARVDYVIAATGRTPNVGGLGLENTSVARDALGVPLFDRLTMQCGPGQKGGHIFIAGDANHDLALLHEAADEGKIAGDNAARWPDVKPGQRRTPLAVVFSDPQLAVVGTRFADLKPGSYVTGEVSFENQGRSRVMLRNRGILHVYADVATGQLLGAELIGPDAEHLAHLLAWAIQSGMTVARSLEMPFYHPVIEEGLRTALRDAQARLDAAQVRRAA